MTLNVALVGGGPASGHRGLHVGDRPVTQGPGVGRAVPQEGLCPVGKKPLTLIRALGPPAC